MDLYSEELILDIDVDSNQEECQQSNNKILDSEIEKQAPIFDAQVISNNLLISVKENQDVSPESGENRNQTIGGKSDLICESQFENKVTTSETEKSSKIEFLETIKLEENSENTEDTQISNKTKEDILDQTIDEPEPLEKKKKGRPRKEDRKDLKPTRESTRKRKSTTALEYNGQIKSRNVWTIAEKEQLLRGMEEFGVDNIEAIQSYIPSKSERGIYNQIRVSKELGRNNLENVLFSRKKREFKSFSSNISKLTEWSKYLENFAKKNPQRLFALSNVFILISEYGKFPKPSECEGIDFRSMYRYLHCMLNGKPYYGMDGKTADILLQCLTNVFRFLQSKSKLDRLLPDILQESNINPIKTYSRAHTKPFPPSAFKKPGAFLNLPGINPLNIPASLLLKGNESEDEDTESESDECSGYQHYDDSSHSEQCDEDDEEEDDEEVEDDDEEEEDDDDEDYIYDEDDVDDDDD